MCCQWLRILREKRLGLSDQAAVAQQVNGSLTAGPATAVASTLVPLLPDELPSSLSNCLE